MQKAFGRTAVSGVMWRSAYGVEQWVRYTSRPCAEGIVLVVSADGGALKPMY